ncbi:hypothetical protein B0H13DRAFT_1870003 [Mycena leptocephala]|nr:hypothetical protein B0H13DRAFT_1870003 [Mycena leptocephala]
MKHIKHEGWDEKTRGMGKSEFNLRCSSGSWDSNEAYKTLEGSDEKTRGMGKSEFNLVQDIRRLLHIPHIFRSVQVDLGIQMKHIGWDEKKLAAWEKASSTSCRGSNNKRAAWTDLLHRLQLLCSVTGTLLILLPIDVVLSGEWNCNGFLIRSPRTTGGFLPIGFELHIENEYSECAISSLP